MAKPIARRLCVMLTLLVPAAGAEGVSLFQVGNSLTVDTLPDGTRAMLEERLGEPVDVGYHVRGNTTIDFLWNNPAADGTETTEFGEHTVALPGNHWDYVTLQSFPSLERPTLLEETARIEDFVRAADLGNGGATEVIVYGPYAGRSASLWDEWDDPVADAPSTSASYSSAYHDLLYDKVEASFPGRTRLASAGKVIREMRERIDAGRAPFDRTSRLYRDAIHLSNAGRFVASTVIQTVLLGESQVGRPPAREHWPEENLSDDEARWIQLVAYDVLLADPRSGVSPATPGDYDGDGDVDSVDKEVFDATLGSSTSRLADGDRDGAVSASDYVVWRDAVSERLRAGDFDGDTRLDDGDRESWALHYGSTTRVPGDLNGNGVVEAADYTSWRDAPEAFPSDTYAAWRADLGRVRRAPADGNGDGRTDAADYTLWRDRVALAAAATPEPGAGLLTLLAAAGGSLVASRSAASRRV